MTKLMWNAIICVYGRSEPGDHKGGKPQNKTLVFTDDSESDRVRGQENTQIGKLTLFGYYLKII